MCLSREGGVLGRKSMVSFGLSRLKLVAAMMFCLAAIGHAHALTIELEIARLDDLRVAADMGQRSVEDHPVLFVGVESLVNEMMNEPA